MSTPSYQDSKQKLIEDLRATAGSGSRQFDIAKAILDVKGYEELAMQSRNLARATWVLAFSTVGLFLATTGLIYVSATLRP